MVLSRHGVGGTWREFHIGLGVRSWSSRKSTFPESSDLPEVPTCTGLRAAGSSRGGCPGGGGLCMFSVPSVLSGLSHLILQLPSCSCEV